MSSLHTVNTERWSNMTIFDQMGNIYSEVGRSFAAKSRGDEQTANYAMQRCLDLFNATLVSLEAKHSVKTKEVLRAREQYLQVFNDNDATKDEISSLDNYFLNFAIAARLNKS